MYQLTMSQHLNDTMCRNWYFVVPRILLAIVVIVGGLFITYTKYGVIMGTVICTTVLFLAYTVHEYKTNKKTYNLRLNNNVEYERIQSKIQEQINEYHKLPILTRIKLLMNEYLKENLLLTFFTTIFSLLLSFNNCRFGLAVSFAIMFVSILIAVFMHSSINAYFKIEQDAIAVEEH